MGINTDRDKNMARFDGTGMDFAAMAENGNVDALFELGLIYATGRDGTPDVVSAHKWFNIAAFRGCEDAKWHREALAAEMSKSEIAEAQRAAREWITHH